MSPAPMIFIAFAASFFSSGVLTGRKVRKHAQSGVDVQATIVSTRAEGRKQTRRHFATFEYMVNGLMYRQELNTDTTSMPGRGHVVTIGYDPVDPQKIYLRAGKGYRALYAFAAVFFVAGVVLFFV